MFTLNVASTYYICVSQKEISPRPTLGLLYTFYILLI